MNKSDYNFAVFIMVLSVISGLFQGTVYLVLGNRIFFQDFFIPWLILLNVIYFAGVAILSKYFNYKEYKPALVTLLLSAVGSLLQMAVLYMMIVEQKYEQYYFQVVVIMLVTSILFGYALAFTNSSERKWLKIAGILILISSGFLLMITFAGPGTQDFQILSALEKTSKWISLSSTLIPLLLVLNFREELKSKVNSKSKAAEYGYGIFGIVSVIAFLAIGIPFISESYSQAYWQGKNQDKTDQLVELFDERIYVGNQGDSLHYLLLKPVQMDPTIAYPLVISLPYSDYEAGAAQILSENVNRIKYPAYIFVPFCPEGKGWGGVPNTPVIDELVFEAIESLDSEENIDTNRRYITGVSRGGYGTWHFITKRPDLFAAAIPVCGEGDTTLASEITGVAVWAFHGKKDENVPVSGSRDMIDAMRVTGKNPKYTEYQNEGHNIWYQVSTEPDLWPWLFSQRKE
ncbi:carboxylesterase family protein [Algoriphagus aquimarinus]|uniref:Prolyl oligopeptidase family protein n=1 Tax=Algoriphagus aquimarinus TaxID=237018 RepID=A0A1I0YJN7_9BACT|nr:prolyl oligopeptidase family serine peptidase [Algoriphagus aquimarinus]SFB12373.1 Prolyl oligopeptidase family protein [Algoriphagus aquimarinus]